MPTRLPFEFDNLGEQTLKGFDQPIRAFSVQLKSGEQIPDAEAGSVIPEFGTGDVHETLQLELPDKPSIAVLPFTNMSADPEQEFLADGVARISLLNSRKFRNFSSSHVIRHLLIRGEQST